MFMELTEEEAAVIKRLARERHYELSLTPGLEYPGNVSKEVFLAGVEAEKKVLRAIGEKAISVSYAQSIHHTLGADAFTEEAAQWLREWLIKFQTLNGHEFFEAWRQLNEILQLHGLQARCLSTNEGGITLK